MRVTALLGLMALASAVGCGRAARLDGANQEAFQASKTEVEASLSEDQKKAFSAALTRLTWQEVREGGNSKTAFARLRTRLSGKTAAEVIEEAKSVKLSALEAAALSALDRAVDEAAAISRSPAPTGWPGGLVGRRSSDSAWP